MILPVKLDLKESITDKAASESPITTYVLGSMIDFLTCSLREKAGILSGMTT